MDDPTDKILSPRARRRGAEQRESMRKRGYYTKMGLEHLFSYLDSTLISRHDHDANDVSYELTFRRALPEGETDLAPYIIKHMEHTAQRPSEKQGMVVADVGGPGRNVVSDLSYIGTRPRKDGWALGVHRSLGLTLEDVHPELKEKDALRRHTVLEADLLLEETEDQVDKWLDGGKIDILFERMLGGLDAMPNDPYFLAQKLDRWYGRLADFGMMFIQVPCWFNRYLEPWAKMLKKNFGEYLEVGYGLGGSNDVVSSESTLIIRKKRDAPVSLPFLDLSAMQEADKKGAAADVRVPWQNTVE